MPAPLAVDKEQVRMLVLSVGVTEASRQTGIDLSTVKQWSSRGKWLAHTRAMPPKLPASMQPTVVTGVTKPADALENVLKQRHENTRLNLSEYVESASKLAASAPAARKLLIAQDVKYVAGIMQAVWPERAAGDPNGPIMLSQVNINIG